MIERRGSPRLVFFVPFAVTVRGGFEATLLDISASGAQIEMAFSLRPHEPCRLRFSVGGRMEELRGVVRRCRASGYGRNASGQRTVLFRAGIEFAESAAEMVEKLAGETSIAPPVAAAGPAEEPEGVPLVEPEGPPRAGSNDLPPTTS